MPCHRSFVVPLRDQQHIVLVGFQIARRFVHKRIKVVKPVKPFACAMRHSTVACGPHGIEPVTDDDHWRADFLCLVQVLRQKPTIAFLRIEVDIRQDQHALAFMVFKIRAHVVDILLFLFNRPRHRSYVFGGVDLVAASAMAGAAFSIPRLTT